MKTTIGWCTLTKWHTLCKSEARSLLFCVNCKTAIMWVVSQATYVLHYHCSEGGALSYKIFLFQNGEHVLSILKASQVHFKHPCTQSLWQSNGPLSLVIPEVYGKKAKIAFLWKTPLGCVLSLSGKYFANRNLKPLFCASCEIAIMYESSLLAMHCICTIMKRGTFHTKAAFSSMVNMF